MKKSIISPLCSAFIIPGLGQVINGEIKKGGIILLSVLAVIISAAIEMYRLIKASLEGLAINELYPEMVISKFKAQDHTILWILSLIFACIWFYSVIDAFIVGKKLDFKEKNHEIISDR